MIRRSWRGVVLCILLGCFHSGAGAQSVAFAGRVIPNRCEVGIQNESVVQVSCRDSSNKGVRLSLLKIMSQPVTVYKTTVKATPIKNGLVVVSISYM